MTLVWTTFSTVNPIFLHDDLISRKNTVYMKNAEERARFEIFWRKSWIFMFYLSKAAKTTGKYANYLLCGFLRNWPCSDFSDFDRIWYQNLPDFHFHFFRPSLNGFPRFFFEIHQNLHENRLRVTPILFNNKKHKIFKQTCASPKVSIVYRYVIYE